MTIHVRFIPLSGSLQLAWMVLLASYLRASAFVLLSRNRATFGSRAKGIILSSRRYFSHQDNDYESSEEGSTYLDRRNFLSQLANVPVLTGAASALSPSGPANAGLMRFPCASPLVNRYHFMRAGTSLVEEEDGIWSTNPLFITNREYALSDAGRALVKKRCQTLVRAINVPTIAYHSLAANGIDTADIVGQELGLGRERILPEFTYLDQRGIGEWNDGAMEDVQPAIWALDAFEANKEGMGGRPPAHEDGTPNETLADQFVRLRQFLSLLESRTSGENILLIFPDGTGPALLSCMIAGIPLNEVHCLHYAPGELRMDISRDSILELYQVKKNDPAYREALELGKGKLALLRQRGKDVLSLKDQRAEDQRLATEKAYRENEEVRLSKQASDMKLAAERRMQMRLEKLNNEKEEGNTNNSDLAQSQSPEIPSSLLAAAGGVSIVGLTVALGMGPKDGKENMDQGQPVSAPLTPVTLGPNGTAAVSSLTPPENGDSRTVISTRSDSTTDERREKNNNDPNRARTILSEDQEEPKASNAKVLQQHQQSDGDSKDADHHNAIQEELGNLEARQGAMDDFLKQEESYDLGLNLDVNEELGKLETAQRAMDNFLDMDDGAADWLRVLADIRDEPDHGDDDDDGNNSYLQVDGEYKPPKSNATKR